MIFGRQDIIATFISRPNARDRGIRAAGGVPPPVGDFLVQQDGTSLFLLQNGTDAIILN